MPVSEPYLGKFLGPNQWSLNYRHWTTEGASATVIGVHGYSEHSGCYQHFAEFLLSKSVDVLWMDLPGHGLSEGARSNIDQFEDYVRSLELCFEEAEKRKCPKPYLLFGHSLGGLIAIRFLQSSSKASQIKRVALSSPFLGLSQYPAAILPLLRLIASSLPNFAWNNEAELGRDILTHDPEMIKRRNSDPLIKSRVTIHFVREFMRARLAAFRDVGKIIMPTAVFQAGDDRVVSRAEAERFFDLLKCEKEKKIYDGLYHEIVNERERSKVMDDIWTWLGR